MPYQAKHGRHVTAVEQVKGATRRTLVDGEKMMIIEWTMESGTTIPLHHHPHEQSGYIASGEMIFNVEGQEHHLTPGMGYLVTGHEPHGARFDVPTVVVDIFSPPREDYRGDKPSTYQVVDAAKPAAGKKSAAMAKAAVKKRPSPKPPEN